MLKLAKWRSGLEFIAMLLVLGAAWLAAMHWLWPRLLAATILIYSAGALVLFAGIALYAIFGRPRH